MYEVNSSEIRIFIGTSLETKPENDSSIPNGSKFIETDTKISYDFSEGNWNPAGSSDLSGLISQIGKLTPEVTDVGLYPRANDEGGFDFVEVEGGSADISKSVFDSMLANGNIEPFLHLERHLSSPIFSIADIPGTTEIMFPCVLDASKHLDAPINKYYCFISPHDNPGGIYLLTSDTPDANWAYHSQVLDRTALDTVDHISSMDVVWNEQAQKYYGYVHSYGSSYWGGQPTFLFTSDDLLTWTLFSTTPVLKTQVAYHVYKSLSYVRVARHNGRWIAIGQSENADSEARQSTFFSDDGITWYPNYSNPVLDGDALGYPSSEVYSTSLLVKGQMIYALSSIVQDTRLDIYLSKSVDGVNFVKAYDNPIFEGAGGTEWDADKVANCYIFDDGDAVYFYYAGRRSTAARATQIGCARFDIGGLI